MATSSGWSPRVRSTWSVSSVRSRLGHAMPVRRAIAAARCWQNVAGSASTGWARYHTAACWLRWTNWPTAVVLPAPAGPTTIVSATCQARSSKRSTRSRATARTAGGSSRALGRRDASMARRAETVPSAEGRRVRFRPTASVLVTGHVAAPYDDRRCGRWSLRHAESGHGMAGTSATTAIRWRSSCSGCSGRPATAPCSASSVPVAAPRARGARRAGPSPSRTRWRPSPAPSSSAWRTRPMPRSRPTRSSRSARLPRRRWCSARARRRRRCLAPPARCSPT